MGQSRACWVQGRDEPWSTARRISEDPLAVFTTFMEKREADSEVYIKIIVAALASFDCFVKGPERLRVVMGLALCFAILYASHLW